MLPNKILKMHNNVNVFHATGLYTLKGQNDKCNVMHVLPQQEKETTKKSLEISKKYIHSKEEFPTAPYTQLSFLTLCRAMVLNLCYVWDTFEICLIKWCLLCVCKQTHTIFLNNFIDLLQFIFEPYKGLTPLE